ncbi:hypothetical protein OAN34_03325 [Hyphomicrobiales bacterium]|mgnify:FL=1|jgi:hypothetical protein|nr:hypothetical protein [Alphaproteobacteria bacterium]MDC0474688.1 hypothetical protein [Hyphomicrobiales bacterium]MBT5663597.1 hypothetical protein [Alphaproteobacteria bacterium]MDG1152070.1 hypothetical protein [Hyphomicrobiales bacterium]MDG1524210.1 hypothetical protein [Hyphomicrobiales bacterium]|tara:strand:+ start:632 stop:1012 length:381 start_codon:yes stop_codon:yes gene_type:complete
MDDLIINIFGVDSQLSRGFIFGLVHVSIMLLGYYSGFSINRLLKIVSNGYVAGIIGAGIAHVLADLIAALLDSTMRPATLGIVFGGLLPLLLVPVLERVVVKSKHHVVIGDHEDVEKDLKSHHHKH